MLTFGVWIDDPYYSELIDQNFYWWYSLYGYVRELLLDGAPIHLVKNPTNTLF